MQPRQLSALFLVGVMALAGCLGATEPAPENEEPTVETYELKATWIASPEEIQLGEVATFTLGIQQEGTGEWTVGYEVLEPDFSPVSDVIWSENDVGFVLSFTPSVVGEHLISIAITNTGPQVMMPELQQQVISMLVMPPDEDAPILTTPARIVLEEPNVVWFEGSVDHRYVDSCSVTYTITDGNDGALGLNEEGAWKVAGIYVS